MCDDRQMIEGNLKRGDRSANTVGMRRHIDRQCVMTDDRYTLMHIENMGERQRETGKIKGIEINIETDREKNSQIEKKKGSAVHVQVCLLFNIHYSLQLQKDAKRVADYIHFAVISSFEEPVFFEWKTNS